MSEKISLDSSVLISFVKTNGLLYLRNNFYY